MAFSQVWLKQRRAPSHKGGKMGTGREKGVNHSLPRSMRKGKHKAKGR